MRGAGCRINEMQQASHCQDGGLPLISECSTDETWRRMREVVMPSDQTTESLKDRALVAWSRPLGVATAAVFVVSSVFPVVAGLTRDTSSFSKWWGVADVGIAFVLALLAFVVVGLAEGKQTREDTEATYRAYRVLLHGIFVLMVVFVLFGDRIVWTHCLTGFAWRSWLLLYGLPAWFTAIRSGGESKL